MKYIILLLLLCSNTIILSASDSPRATSKTIVISSVEVPKTPIKKKTKVKQRKKLRQDKKRYKNKITRGGDRGNNDWNIYLTIGLISIGYLVFGLGLFFLLTQVFLFLGIGLSLGGLLIGLLIYALSTIIALILALVTTPKGFNQLRDNGNLPKPNKPTNAAKAIAITLSILGFCFPLLFISANSIIILILGGGVILALIGLLIAQIFKIKKQVKEQKETNGQ